MIDLIFWRANCYKRYPARWNRIIRGLRNGLLESNAKSIKFRVTVSPTYNSVERMMYSRCTLLPGRSIKDDPRLRLTYLEEY